MVDIIKNIDGIYYVIYVVVLSFIVLVLIGYLNERKTIAWQEALAKKEKERLDYERSKKNSAVLNKVPEVQKQDNNPFVASSTPVVANPQPAAQPQPAQQPQKPVAVVPTVNTAPAVPTVTTPAQPVAQVSQPTPVVAVNNVPKPTVQVMQQPAAQPQQVQPTQPVQQPVVNLTQQPAVPAQPVAPQPTTLVINSQQPTNNGGNV